MSENSQIQGVEVVPGCISCRNCENVCPDIFKVSPKSQVISHHYEGRESEILQAEALCPVHVIKVQKPAGLSLAFKTASLQSKQYLTDDVLELVFSCEDFKARAGQYISLRMSDAYGDFSRSYSLASYGSDFFTITVKILEKGRGSKVLHALKLGQRLKYLGGLGAFTLKDTPKAKVCIATGTGLAPMIPILQEADPEVKKILLFGVRYQSDIYYDDILQKIPNLEIHYCVSRPESGEGCRVTDKLDLIETNSEVYLCGSPLMIHDVQNRLEGIQEEKNFDIYRESFTLSSDYKGRFDYHILKGNIPYKKQISWVIILLSLFVIVPSWFYMARQGNLYASLGPIESYMSFLYDVSWYSVVFVMAIRPLSDIFPKIGILSSLRYFRKSGGILSSSIIVVNFLGNFIFNPTEIGAFFTLAKWSLWTPLIARFSELSAIVLLMTSNDVSQKTLGKWWKRIQRLSYVYFISGGIIAGLYAPYKVYVPMVIVGVLYALAAYKNTKK